MDRRELLKGVGSCAVVATLPAIPLALPVDSEPVLAVSIRVTYAESLQYLQARFEEAIRELLNQTGGMCTPAQIRDCVIAAAPEPAIEFVTINWAD